MEKKGYWQKHWQLYTIAGVLLLTFYNILPTLLYYTKPLHRSIQKEEAEEIVEALSTRINSLEREERAWITSFCKLLGISLLSIDSDPVDVDHYTITFGSKKEASIFEHHLPRASAVIPFEPYAFMLETREKRTGEKQTGEEKENNNRKVVIRRTLPIQIAESERENFFQFSEKLDAQGSPTPLYESLILDRLFTLVMQLTTPGTSAENLELIDAITRIDLSMQGPEKNTRPDAKAMHALSRFAQKLIAMEKHFQGVPHLKELFLKNLIASSTASPSTQPLLHALALCKDQVKFERVNLEKIEKTGIEHSDTTKDSARLLQLTNEETILREAELILRKHHDGTGALKNSYKNTYRNPWTVEEVGDRIREALQNASSSGSKKVVVDLEGFNPIVQKIVLDWEDQAFHLVLSKEVQELENRANGSYATESPGFKKEILDQSIFDLMAQISTFSSEKVVIRQGQYLIPFDTTEGTQSFVILRLSMIAKKEIAGVLKTLRTQWHPLSSNLSSFPIVSLEEYEKLPAEQKAFCLLVYSPIEKEKVASGSLQMNSIYVVGKGIEEIRHNLLSQATHSSQLQGSQEAQLFQQDLEKLRHLLQLHFFTPSELKRSHFSTPFFSYSFSSDLLLEKKDFHTRFLEASKENFLVRGSKRFALLEFANLEQRILHENKIATEAHQTLLRWRDLYRSAQLGVRGALLYEVPQPTHNVLWSNFKTSLAKYLRGDSQKVLKWGLELSGGKTVQIELRDQNNKVVTNPSELDRAIDELQARINKLGVSEVAIRREGSTLTIDFPSSQGISASELIQASSMQFHIVNEKFSNPSSPFHPVADQFLQEVWNEALITGKTDPEGLQWIAWQHLYGEDAGIEENGNKDSSKRSFKSSFKTEAARQLFDQGLRLANPKEPSSSRSFNDSISQVVCFSEHSLGPWDGSNHPLLIVFDHYALEGADLDHIRASYDPSKGHFLIFDIRSSRKVSLPSTGQVQETQKITPREDLLQWTSRFSRDQIQGTLQEKFSLGRGWRMAVLLNGKIVSAPSLESPLKESGMITGRFSQIELSHLEADLKAGTLSYTPKILSEQNVSSELGIKEKKAAFLGLSLALLLIVLMMSGYYRFAGLIASIAVLFNLLILWGVLQNIHATLTLAGIAAIVLNVGMAVDANVLVYERIREELLLQGPVQNKLFLAIGAGYKRAFSAIVDSNITTLLAGASLLLFSSGPVQGFAITLMIGVISSMFTALFMTRTFFSYWIQAKKERSLKMAQWFKIQGIQFLKYGPHAMIISLVLFALGIGALAIKKDQIYGIDFTGGFSATVQLEPIENSTSSTSYRDLVEKVLLDKGLSAHTFQVRELNPRHHIRIFLSKSVGDFVTQDPSQGKEHTLSEKANWLQTTLQEGGIILKKSSSDTASQNWTEISPQVSSQMKWQALCGIGLALVCILVYIALRFEFKYAISATLCMAYDALITLAAIAFLNALGAPIQIDLHAIAAILTIVGYSLNDTIIVFDRIREEVRLARKETFGDTINRALNITLSRTIITSGTTFIVLIPMILFGGATLFSFCFVMAIGVVLGTLSSLYIATPLLHYFHGKEYGQEYREGEKVVTKRQTLLDKGR